MPERIQRRRVKGWRMPAGAVYVGRPSRWGNPFPWRGDWIVWAAVAAGFRADRAGRRAAAVAYFRCWLRDGRLAVGPEAGRDSPGAIEYASGVVLSEGEAARGIAALIASLPDYRIRVPQPPPLVDVRAELRGKDLACWCPLGEPCHADVLLEIANGGGA